MQKVYSDVLRQKRKVVTEHMARCLPPGVWRETNPHLPVTHSLTCAVEGLLEAGEGTEKNPAFRPGVRRL